MYLTELYRFYERMTQDPQSGMPPEGMSAERAAFLRKMAMKAVGDF